MTISTQASQVTLLGNGVTTTFNFPFVGAAAADIQVTYKDAANNQTILNPSQYTLVLNAPAAGQLWGVGGTVTYPTAGPAIANGTSLTISRIVPLTQTVTISNQGDFAPQVIEQAMDLLELQIQQVAARTGQLRGAWATGIVYNVGDVVVDGANGANTGNFYMCGIQNTSGVWATDLAAGDWSLAYIGLTSASITGVLGYTPMRGSNNLSELTSASSARANLGLGSIATQNANNVALTGGAVNGAVIGGVTPAAGTFTTLTATTLTNSAITNSSINNTSIGLSTPAAADFTALSCDTGTVNGGNIVNVGDSQTLSNKILNAPGISGGSPPVWGVGFYLSASNSLGMATNTTLRAQIDGNGNFIVGRAALTTGATAGFLWLPSCPGAPSGVPGAPYSGAVALIIDSTDSKLYVRIGSSWKSVALT